jgi:hypothetical protein
MKKYAVKIFLEKYMQHRMDIDELGGKENDPSPLMTRTDFPKEELIKAEHFCYRNIHGKCYVPSEHIKQAMVNGASQVKAKVGATKKSITTFVSAYISVKPEEIIVRDWDMPDKRTAVNKNTHARIITIRPRWNNLELEFSIEVNYEGITDKMVKSCLEYAGSMFGIGSYRPQHKGEFGTFKILEFKEVSN